MLREKAIHIILALHEIYIPPLLATIPYHTLSEIEVQNRYITVLQGMKKKLTV